MLVRFTFKIVRAIEDRICCVGPERGKESDTSPNSAEADVDQGRVKYASL